MHRFFRARNRRGTNRKRTSFQFDDDSITIIAFFNVDKNCVIIVHIIYFFSRNYRIQAGTGK